MQLKSTSEYFVICAEDVKDVSMIAMRYKRSLENDAHSELSRNDYEKEILKCLQKVYPTTLTHVSYVASYNSNAGWTYSIKLNFKFTHMEDVRRFTLREPYARAEFHCWKTKNVLTHNSTR